MERYLRVNLLGPGPRLMKKEFTGPRSHKGLEKLVYCTVFDLLCFFFFCRLYGAMQASAQPVYQSGCAPKVLSHESSI